MTLRLILTRHAKSDWDNPLDTDHQRPLSARGQHAAPLIGQWLAQNGFAPQQALVSDATRTRQTWGLISTALADGIDAQFLPALYLAGPDFLLRVLQSAQAKNVILIAHNPGIAEFAAQLVAQRPDHAQFSRYPTCATLVAEFDAPDWGKLRLGTGQPVAFIVPRDLG